MSAMHPKAEVAVGGYRLLFIERTQICLMVISVQVDLLGTFSIVSDTGIPVDIGLHSNSLAFCFRFPFGLDTLFVNGCFEELSSDGFVRFTKCLGIGNLNAIGVRVAFSSLWHLDVVLLMLRQLRGIQNRLARQWQT